MRKVTVAVISHRPGRLPAATTSYQPPGTAAEYMTQYTSGMSAVCSTADADAHAVAHRLNPTGSIKRRTMLTNAVVGQ